MVETSTSSSHSLTPLTAPLSLQNIVTKRRRESVDIKLQSTNSEHVDDNVVDISNKFEKKKLSATVLSEALSGGASMRLGLETSWSVCDFPQSD